MVDIPGYLSLKNQMIGNTLAALRVRLSLSQQEVADFIGTNRHRIMRIENGESSPTIPELELLSRLFGVSVNALITPVKADDRASLRLNLERAVENPLRLNEVVGPPIAVFELGRFTDDLGPNIKISPDNQLVAILGDQNRPCLYLLPVQDGEPIQVPVTASTSYSATDIALHNNQLAVAWSGSEDADEEGDDKNSHHIIQTWKLNRAEENFVKIPLPVLWTMGEDTGGPGYGRVENLALGGSGGNLLAAYNKSTQEMTVFDLENNVEQNFKGVPSGTIARLAISPDGKWLCAGTSYDGMVHVFNLKKKYQSEVGKDLLGGGINSCTFFYQHQTQYLAVAGNQGTWAVFKPTNYNISCMHWQREERFGKYDHIDQLVVATPSCYLGIRRFFAGEGPDSTHLTALTNLVTRRTVFVAESRLRDEDHPSIQISEHILVKAERSGRVTIHPLNLAPLIVSELQIISEKDSDTWNELDQILASGL